MFKNHSVIKIMLAIWSSFSSLIYAYHAQTSERAPARVIDTCMKFWGFIHVHFTCWPRVQHVPGLIRYFLDGCNGKLFSCFRRMQIFAELVHKLCVLCLLFPKGQSQIFMESPQIVRVVNLPEGGECEEPKLCGPKFCRRLKFVPDSDLISRRT